MAGYLDPVVVVPWRSGNPERLELVSGMPDDISGLDLGDGGAWLVWPDGQGGGKVHDPFERRSLVF